jgi:hypothetical protein|tara:strand:+ start:217 stop:522 length:306 start_codon:yes stop_codon:yes gene_type:complete
MFSIPQLPQLENAPMIKLNRESIDGHDLSEQIAVCMYEAGIEDRQIVIALDTLQNIGDIEHPDLRAVMLIDQWPDSLRRDWEGNNLDVIEQLTIKPKAPQV